MITILVKIKVQVADLWKYEAYNRNDYEVALSQLRPRARSQIKLRGLEPNMEVLVNYNLQAHQGAQGL